MACRMSRWLRSRSAEESERSALYGVDPFHLANLAMQDAKRAIALYPRGLQGYKLLVGKTLSISHFWMLQTVHPPHSASPL